MFNVNVNVKPESKVTFNLTYEELLTRRLGRYEQAININPDQVRNTKNLTRQLAKNNSSVSFL